MPSRSDLDNLLVNVELTLVSIVQGVALSFLADATRVLWTAGADLTFAIYAVNGVLVILLFWSRAVLHTFTVIRWPLELPHYFLYFGCALAEAEGFTRLTDPVGWNACQAAFAALAWILFAVDLRMILAGEAGACTPAETDLYRALHRDQYRNLQLLVPAFFVYHLSTATYLALDGQRTVPHWVFGLAQMLGLTGYLVYLLRFARRLSGLVSATFAA